MIRRSLSFRRGASLVGVLLATSLLTLGFLWYGRGGAAVRRSAAHLHEDVVASLYATELLEFLRSHSPDRLKGYLSTNPIDPALPPYPLCANINLLDRQNTSMTRTLVLNADPLAALPVPGALPDPGAAGSPNRFYQIQIVDLKTLTPRRDLCERTAREIRLWGRPPQAGETVTLGPDERFLLTVGVSWIPRGKTVAEARRIALTTVVAEP